MSSDRRRKAAALSSILLGLGFALPLAPPFGLLRTVLLRKPRR